MCDVCIRLNGLNGQKQQRTDQPQWCGRDGHAGKSHTVSRLLQYGADVVCPGEGGNNPAAAIDQQARARDLPQPQK